jgi:hypothetical protein
VLTRKINNRIKNVMAYEIALTGLVKMVNINRDRKLPVQIAAGSRVWLRYDSTL